MNMIIVSFVGPLFVVMVVYPSVIVYSITINLFIPSVLFLWFSFGFSNFRENINHSSINVEHIQYYFREVSN